MKFIRRIRLFIIDVRIERVVRLLDRCERRKRRLLARLKKLDERYFRIKT